MVKELIKFEKVEQNLFLYSNDDAKIEVKIEPNLDEPCTTVVLHLGGAMRKIRCLNETNPVDAIWSAIMSFKRFVKSDPDLKRVAVSIQNKDFPIFDDKIYKRDLGNKELDHFDLSNRAINALKKKNNIHLKKDIPSNLGKIKKLNGIGPKTAQEIYEKLFATQTEEIVEEPLDNSKTIKTAKLVVDSGLPENLQHILIQNLIHFVKDIPDNKKSLMKLDGVGPSKAHKILEHL